DVGTGSGYQAAVLAELAREVYSIERIPELAEHARKALAAAGYERVHVQVGDGTLGLPEYAPYDGIAVAAAAPELPPPLWEGPRERVESMVAWCRRGPSGARVDDVEVSWEEPERLDGFRVR